MKRIVVLALLAGVSSSVVNAGDKDIEMKVVAAAESEKAISRSLCDLIDDEKSLHDGTQAYHDKLTMLDLYAALGGIEDIDDAKKEVTVRARLFSLTSGDTYYRVGIAAIRQKYAMRLVRWSQNYKHTDGVEDNRQICKDRHCSCRRIFGWGAAHWFKK